MDMVRTHFEAWFSKHFDWYITRNRRGYKLTRGTDGEYMWPIPADAWVVWQAAHGVYMTYGEK